MNTETLDILDFSELSQESVKAKQREERVKRLAFLARKVKYAAAYPDILFHEIRDARNFFLAEV